MNFLKFSISLNPWLWSAHLQSSGCSLIWRPCPWQVLPRGQRVCLRAVGVGVACLHLAPCSYSCVCVPCPWSCFWLTGVTKGRPQHRAMSKVQLRNKSWPRRAHTVCTHSGVSGIMRAASKDISLHGALHYPWISAKSKDFLEQLVQSTLLLFQLPASARGIGDSGVSTVQRAIVREILQRSAVDVRPADLRGLLCDLVCRVQFAHIKHTWARTNMMCTLRCTEVEHLAESVCGAQWSVSQEQGLWRGDQLDQDTLFFPTMKVLGWPAVYMWVYLVIFVCVSSMSVW